MQRFNTCFKIIAQEFEPVLNIFEPYRALHIAPEINSKPSMDVCGARGLGTPLSAFKRYCRGGKWNRLCWELRGAFHQLEWNWLGYSPREKPTPLNYVPCSPGNLLRASERFISSLFAARRGNEKMLPKRTDKLRSLSRSTSFVRPRATPNGPSHLPRNPIPLKTPTDSYQPPKSSDTSRKIYCFVYI